MPDRNPKMLVWCCNNYSQYKKLKVGKHFKRLKCGGLGDRIKALITVKIWAQLLKKLDGFSHLLSRAWLFFPLVFT